MNKTPNLNRAIVQNNFVTLAVMLICQASARVSAASDFFYGCRSRPACGKVCKLVCDTTKLVSVGYGCECTQICIPGPSRRGCKHCETRCCCDDEIKGCRPKIELCWYDWFACGCAKPRTVKVLTKYQAEKEICTYHWEVVDGCDCCCPGPCHCVYKPAPPEAAVGDVIEVSPDERAQLASYVSDDQPETASQVGPAVDAQQAAAAAPKPPTWQRLAKFWRNADEQQ